MVLKCPEGTVKPLKILFYRGPKSTSFRVEILTRILFRHLNFQKCSEAGVLCTFCTFWLWNVMKCASRHNGVHFFDISTSKSAPRVLCFVRFLHFDFEMWWNVLRAKTACAVSTSQLPKVVRTWGASCVLTWKRASRHNGVHFFDIAASKSGPTLVSFVNFDLKMCFAPQRRAIFHLSSGQLFPRPPL